MGVAPISEGEVWAYRKAPYDPIEVTVIKVVSQSGNANVRVQFDDGPRAGEIDWVSRRSLKAPWKDVDSFLAGEYRRTEVRAAGGGQSRAVREAAAYVIDEVLGDGIARYDAYGVLNVEDLDALNALVPKALTLEMCERSYEVGGSRYFQWPAMVHVARDLSPAHAFRLMSSIEKDEPGWVESLQESEGADPWSKAVLSGFNIVRSWCGSEAAEKWSEIERLRKDNARLHTLIGKAINIMERQADSYYTYHAKRIRGELERSVGSHPDWLNAR